LCSWTLAPFHAFWLHRTRRGRCRWHRDCYCCNLSRSPTWGWNRNQIHQLILKSHLNRTQNAAILCMALPWGHPRINRSALSRIVIRRIHQDKEGIFKKKHCNVALGARILAGLICIWWVSLSTLVQFFRNASIDALKIFKKPQIQWNDSLTVEQKHLFWA
jgi:hypothetical protein